MRQITWAAQAKPASKVRRVLGATHVVSALGASLLLCSHAAWAQQIKPGLWENTITMKSASPETEAALARMQQQLASMPPEQRQQMETMMASRGVTLGAGKVLTARHCVSAEQAARGELQTADSRCQQTDRSRSGNTVRFKFVCQAGAQGGGSGEGEYTLVSDTEHRGKMLVNAQRKGKTEQMQMETTGKWLGAECGALKAAR